MIDDEKMTLIRRHIGLEELLQLATPDELVAISDILLDKAHDRLLGDDSARQRLAQCFAAGELYKVVDEIAFEIRALGSVSLASLLRRGEPVSYDEVVRDVASELKIEYSNVDSASSVENKVLEMLVEKLTEQADTESQTTKGLWFGRARLKTSFTSLLWPLSKLGLGTAGGSLVAAGMLSALPLTAIGAVTVGILVFRSKARPELEGLTTIVVHIARIRAGIVAADHEDFANRLRACL
ncbi:hypothetical protein NVV30_24510 [Pseudomonas syringae]|uniref:hypothetical protein n=1 Tax=Pseudomonas syringae TaxID=317 RepID=UPI00215A6F8C|nr:hypothetical protein [Pseudomonas syringae]MCR8721842.1 hypothetical protein [Pseudomonas syringae]